MMFGIPKPGVINHTYFRLNLLKSTHCNRCRTAAIAHIGSIIRYHNEYVLATAVLIGPHPAPLAPGIFIDTSWNHFTFFPSIEGPLGDSTGLILKNIFASVHYRPYHATTVNRWKAYTNINSPEPTNKNVIFAAKNKPLTYNFGIVDKDKDSINVKPLWITYSHELSPFHPNFLCQGNYSQQFIKQAFTDSSYALPYQTGYSPAQPFGSNANYTLNNKTGEISFIPPGYRYIPACLYHRRI
ncbi:MAG TPA: hypothetical protein PL009_06505 [Flavipsychrobacter sp.]|nr:hypothetical protein [Flavipsychrobacter sp.]